MCVRMVLSSYVLIRGMTTFPPGKMLGCVLIEGRVTFPSMNHRLMRFVLMKVKTGVSPVEWKLENLSPHLMSREG